MIFALLFAVSMAAGAFAQTVDFQYSLGGSARYGLIDRDDNETLYSLIGSRLFIADVSNISTPVEISSLALPGIARRIAQSGDILYISCSHGGLAAVDVSDRANPFLRSVTTFDTADKIGQTFGVAVKGNYVCVADYTGVYALDASNPNLLDIKREFKDFKKDPPFDNATVEDPVTYDAYIDNNTLFISCEKNGLYIFDIGNNTALNKISHYLGQFYGIDVLGF
jgi:hypothetical protein